MLPGARPNRKLWSLAPHQGRQARPCRGRAGPKTAAGNPSPDACSRLWPVKPRHRRCGRTPASGPGSRAGTANPKPLASDLRPQSAAQAAWSRARPRPLTSGPRLPDPACRPVLLSCAAWPPGPAAAILPCRSRLPRDAVWAAGAPRPLPGPGRGGGGGRQAEGGGGRNRGLSGGGAGSVRADAPTAAPQLHLARSQDRELAANRPFLQGVAGDRRKLELETSVLAPHSPAAPLLYGLARESKEIGRLCARWRPWRCWSAERSCWDGDV